MNYGRWAVLTGVATWMTVALIFYRGVAIAATEFEKHLESV